MNNTRQTESVRLAARLVAVALALAVAAIPFALVLLRVLQHGRFAGLDSKVSRALSQLAFRSTRTHALFEVVTHLGDKFVLATIVLVIAGGLQLLRRRRESAFLLTTAVGGVLLAAVLKWLIAYARSVFVEPVADNLDKAFPSGHAMNSAFVYGALLIIAWPLLPPAPRWVVAIGTASLVTAIAASRVALGMHYISDVIIGGVAFGLAWLAAAVWAFARYRREAGETVTISG